jgi:molybdate-binding protein/DNA-binding transcriptional regulator YhcF (GntR family)
MGSDYIYEQIAESVRQEVFSGRLASGDRLPPVRDMAQQWGCTIGTVQRAYQILAQQGLVVSRPGQGTRVVAMPPAARGRPLRRAALVQRAEAFLLETVTAGYTPAEVSLAMQLAMDRWRVLQPHLDRWPTHTFHFVGSHDPAMAFISAHFNDIAPEYTPELTFAGSLGGLMALATGQADLAGAHLWDEESDTYNVAFVRRLLPGRRVALLTLAHRRLGLMAAPTNPLRLKTLADLTRPGVQFVNRQAGAGTRVWLDAQLQRLGLASAAIQGYHLQANTHAEVAQAIAEGRANVGLGVESAALAFGLDFVPLTTERYDLVIPEDGWQSAPVQALGGWLNTAAARKDIAALGGYDVAETGQVMWVG